MPAAILDTVRTPSRPARLAFARVAGKSKKQSLI